LERARRGIIVEWDWNAQETTLRVSVIWNKMVIASRHDCVFALEATPSLVAELVTAGLFNSLLQGKHLAQSPNGTTP